MCQPVDHVQEHVTIALDADDAVGGEVGIADHHQSGFGRCGVGLIVRRVGLAAIRVAAGHGRLDGRRRCRDRHPDCHRSGPVTGLLVQLDLTVRQLVDVCFRPALRARFEE